MTRGNRLRRANDSVASWHTHFVRVDNDCMIRRAAKAFHLSSMEVALAASYYQRAVNSVVSDSTASKHPSDRKLTSELQQVLCPFGVIRFMHQRLGSDVSFQARRRDSNDDAPLLVYAVCLNLAVKVTRGRGDTHAPKRLGGYSLRNVVAWLHRQVFGTAIRPEVHLTTSEVFFVEMWVLRRIEYALRPCEM